MLDIGAVVVAASEAEAALAAAVAGIRLMAAIAGGMVVVPVEVHRVRMHFLGNHREHGGVWV